MSQVELGDSSPHESLAFVVFGASGDLTRRKLVPALYNLHLDGLLPEKFAIIGLSRSPFTDEEFAAELERGIERHSRRPLDRPRWDEIRRRVSYVPGSFDDAACYERLDAKLREVDGEHGCSGNRLYYLAVPPSVFPTIVDRLRSHRLNRPGDGGHFARVVVEKPVGRDLQSARELNRVVNRAFHERDVFRIDHYLGKETVQNLLVFRFANAIFEPLWNHKYVNHVQITVAESIGVGSRGRYFEESGTTRDMLQNHMFQLLCLTAMEPPASLAPDSIRDEKVKVLQSLRPVDPDEIGESTVRAQYAAGVSGGEAVPGYLEEEGVAADSCTETFVAARLFIDNWRWAGVPFYLRSGKRLKERVTEIAMRFSDVPHHLFQGRMTTNTLAIRIQPDEGITLTFNSKVPGNPPEIRSVSADFLYGDTAAEAPGAYERLLIDAANGDSTLFIRRDEVEGSWAYVDQLFTGWKRLADGPLPEYAAGTWGPAESAVLLARDGRRWRKL